MDDPQQDPLRADILRELFELRVLDEHELRAELTRRPESEQELPTRGFVLRVWRQALFGLAEAT